MKSLIKKENINFDLVFVISSFIIVALMGFICIYSYSKSVKLENSAVALTTILMVTASSLFIGHLIGFLFGMPRTVQEKSDNYKSEKTLNKKIEYQINTNLEQISDWLTKMLIGIGLVESNNLMEFIYKISSKIAKDIDTPNSESIIIASIIYFLILGFFGTYFAVRLYMARAIAIADVGLQSITTESIIKKSDSE